MRLCLGDLQSVLVDSALKGCELLTLLIGVLICSCPHLAVIEVVPSYYRRLSPFGGAFLIHIPSLQSVCWCGDALTIKALSMLLQVVELRRLHRHRVCGGSFRPGPGLRHHEILSLGSGRIPRILRTIRSHDLAGRLYLLKLL